MMVASCPLACTLWYSIHNKEINKSPRGATQPGFWHKGITLEKKLQMETSVTWGVGMLQVLGQFTLSSALVS